MTLKSLIGTVLGLGRKTRKQAANRARPAVEALESRELLSAGVAPRYALNHGNLFKQTGRVRQLVDRHVVQYAAGKGGATVYALEADHELRQFGPGGPRGGRLIDRAVQSFTLGKDGATVTERRRDGTAWQALAGARSVQIRGLLAAPADAPQQTGDEVLSSAVAADGTAYTLFADHDLWKFPQGQGAPARLDYNVQSFALAPDGAVYTLSFDHNLWKFPHAQPGDYTRLDFNVQSFSLAADGAVYTLSYDHNLWRFPQGRSDYSRLDSNVESFAVATDGTVYTLSYNHNLWRFPHGQPDDSLLDYNVQSFALAADGTVYTLSFDHNLWKFLHGGSDYSRLDYNVQDFALAADGTIYTLSLSRNLWMFPHGQGDGKQLDENVARFAILDDGSVHVFYKDDVLRVWGSGGADGISVTLSDGVLRIAGGSAMLNGQEVTAVPQSAVKRLEVYGLGGDDYIDVREATIPTLVHGGDGNDTVYGGQGGGVLIGGGGNDFLAGGRGSDTIEGGAGNDTLIGNDGNDLLAGGDGSDVLEGRGDNDLIIEYGRLDGEVGSHDDSDAVVVWGSDYNVIRGGDNDDWLIKGTTTQDVVNLEHSFFDSVWFDANMIDYFDSGFAFRAAGGGRYAMDSLQGNQIEATVNGGTVTLPLAGYSPNSGIKNLTADQWNEVQGVQKRVADLEWQSSALDDAIKAAAESKVSSATTQLDAISQAAADRMKWLIAQTLSQPFLASAQVNAEEAQALANQLVAKAMYLDFPERALALLQQQLINPTAEQAKQARDKIVQEIAPYVSLLKSWGKWIWPR